MGLAFAQITVPTRGHRDALPRPRAPTPSVRRDPGLADDRAVAPVVARDQVAQRFAAGEIEIVAQGRQALLHLGELADLADFLGQPLDHLARRLGRRRDAEPDTDIEA